MKTIRPKTLIVAVNVVWTATMAFLIFVVGPIWASYERQERRLARYSAATERRDVPQATIHPPQTSPAGVKPPNQILAHAAARLCGADPNVIWSLFLRESSGRHYDAQGNVLRSRSNAYGLGQIKLGTARDVSPTLDIMNPWENAVAASCHFRGLMDKFGDTRTALHAYHAGEGTVRRRKVQAKTRQYAEEILEGAAQ